MSANNLAPLHAYLDSVSHRGRTMLLPALHYAQSLYGWLPREIQSEISRSLKVPAADIHGVIEFYSMLYNEPTPRKIVRFCEDPACSIAGFKSLSEQASALLKDRIDQGDIAIEHVPCLGMCEMAPAALIAERPGGNLTPQNLPDFLKENHPEPKTRAFSDNGWLLGRVGKLDPESLDDYLAHGGFETAKAVFKKTPEEILALVESAGILGRGGAMFPLGRKWRFTRAAHGTPSGKHIVVNADESEPGTFKDRVLLEDDPFAVIEAAMIAGFAIGAENGWIFLRGEYPRARRRLTNAIEAARAGGLLGENALGIPGFRFDIELRIGAGAYICGEETALFEAIEGKRGFPRIKPPFPVTHGLFSQPTTINNVETLVAVLAALTVGVESWNHEGTKSSPGTKLFCLSGHVEQPGVYELPFGSTVREVIERAGGVRDGRPIQAVLMGGAAGKFIGPDELDLRLTYEDTRDAHVPLGSGVVQVFNDTTDMRQVLYELARFFAHESCGKCFPCQLGTQRQVEILDGLVTDKHLRPDHLEALSDVGFAMTYTSLCGLGQTAASATLSAIDRWPEWFTQS